MLWGPGLHLGPHLESLITAFAKPLDFEEKDKNGWKGKGWNGKKRKGREGGEKIKTWVSEPKGNDAPYIIKMLGWSKNLGSKLLFARSAHKIVTCFKTLKSHRVYYLHIYTETNKWLQIETVCLYSLKKYKMIDMNQHVDFCLQRIKSIIRKNAREEGKRKSDRK